MKQETFAWLGSRNLQIYAQSWSPDVGPLAVILLIHGLGEHCGRYQHVAEAFTQAGYAVLGFDLPGHGKTQGKRGHSSFDEINAEIDHLQAEAARRFPRKPIFLYGHSLGGEATLYYMLKRRPGVRGAIVTSPGLATGAPVPAWKILAARSLNKLAPDFTLDNGLDRSNLSRDRQVVEKYNRDPLVHNQISARLGWDLLENGQWILENAGSLSTTTLLMQGSHDRIVSVQATQRFAKSAPPEKISYKEWDGFYHETHNEPEKQQVIQYMLDWISKQR